MTTTSTYNKLIENARAELGHTIRALRVRNNLTTAQLAYRARMSRSKISKIENGRVGVTAGTINTISDALGLDVRESEELSAQVEELHSPYCYAQGDHDPQINSEELVKSEESQATVIRVCVSLTFPALLQTADYGTLLLQARLALFPETKRSNLDDLLSLRMQRLASVWDTRKRCRFLIDQSVLRSPALDRSIMLGQLEHIHTVMQLKTVDVRFFELDFFNCALGDDFTLIDDRFLEVDVLGNDFHSRNAREILTFHRYFESGWDSATGGDDALTMVQDAIAQLKSAPESSDDQAFQFS